VAPAEFHRAALSFPSSNAKTGPIAVSSTSRLTCPSSCSLAGDQGCYAEAGFHTRLHWDRLSAGRVGTTAAAFIQQVAATLTLPHLRGIHARVETLTGPFDVICCRAFASLPDFVSWSRSALAEQGVWMAMKGKHPQTEIDGLPADVNVFHVEPLAVPGLDVERCMVWLKPLALV
jgi:hypothetical protein